VIETLDDIVEEWARHLRRLPTGHGGGRAVLLPLLLHGRLDRAHTGGCTGGGRAAPWNCDDHRRSNMTEREMQPTDQAPFTAKSGGLYCAHVR
jgi:hypothetical protein